GKSETEETEKNGKEKKKEGETEQKVICFSSHDILFIETLAPTDSAPMAEARVESAVPPFVKWCSDFSRVFQYYLDRSVPQPTLRWVGTLAAVLLFALRIYYVQGFYVVSYGLGIYVLNLLIQFLSPKIDPELESLDGASLPTKTSDEFRPFIRRLPEFKFWYTFTKAVLVASFLTLFPVLDVPVFWPILVLYWIVLFVLTMRKQVMHMIKYKYVPFDFGKKVSVSGLSA
ncbi:unnamed protein product, partial [Linum tenue]